MSLSQQKLLAHVVRALEDAAIPYMVTGSFVSSYLGEPRSTHDVDVVIQISPAAIAKLAASFPSEEFAFDVVAAQEALTRGDQFQAMEFASGDKIDFWLLKDTPFERSAFARRYRRSIAGIEAFIPATEDLILQKLRWAKDYQSERQYNDALSVYELQFAKLDLPYLNRWVVSLQLQSVWDQMLLEAQPVRDDR